MQQVPTTASAAVLQQQWRLRDYQNRYAARLEFKQRNRPVRFARTKWQHHLVPVAATAGVISQQEVLCRNFLGLYF